MKRHKSKVSTHLVMTAIVTITVMFMVVIANATKAEPVINVQESQQTYVEPIVEIEATQPVITYHIQDEYEIEQEELQPTEPLFTQEELHAVARTLSGECYDNQVEDKRNVAWVICNRVTDGRFGEGIVGVVTAKNQFVGYWSPGREISESDWEIAEEVLEQYLSGTEPIHDYLYFTGDTGLTNNFR